MNMLLINTFYSKKILFCLFINSYSNRAVLLRNKVCVYIFAYICIHGYFSRLLSTVEMNLNNSACTSILEVYKQRAGCTEIAAFQIVINSEFRSAIFFLYLLTFQITSLLGHYNRWHFKNKNFRSLVWRSLHMKITCSFFNLKEKNLY